MHRATNVPVPSITVFSEKFEHAYYPELYSVKILALVFFSDPPILCNRSSHVVLYYPAVHAISMEFLKF